MKSPILTIAAERKQDGMLHRFGAAHGSWALKQKKLRALGIEWRSPADLNPGVVFD